MHTSRTALLAILAAAIGCPADDSVKKTAPLQQFQDQINAYLKLRKTVADQLPAPKSTPSAPDLASRKKDLAANLAKARAGAKQGSIFTSEVAAEFRRLGKLAMEGNDGARVRESLKRAEPVQGNVRVNQVYPSSVPLQSMPPTLLMGLPNLPMELEYCLVSKTLVLRDSESSLIIDFLPEAVP